MNTLKQELCSLAESNMIDEIRFLDCGELEPKEIFNGRQPLDIMPEGKSLIITSIYIGRFFLPGFDPEIHARTSRLTLSGYYFNVVEPLIALQEHLASKGYKARIFDGLKDEDSIPLKAAAIKAGLGWNGKNTLLLSEKYGTFQAIGGIITDANLGEVYPINENKCGRCAKCMEACPSGALQIPMVLHRENCISNFLEEEMIPSINNLTLDNYFFECDACQEACPWNRLHLSNPLPTRMGKTFIHADSLLERFSFHRLMAMSEEDYNKEILPLLTGFPLSYELFKRNVKLAWETRSNNEAKQARNNANQT